MNFCSKLVFVYITLILNNLSSLIIWAYHLLFMFRILLYDGAGHPRENSKFPAVLCHWGLICGDRHAGFCRRWIKRWTQIVGTYIPTVILLLFIFVYPIIDTFAEPTARCLLDTHAKRAFTSIKKYFR